MKKNLNQIEFESPEWKEFIEKDWVQTVWKFFEDSKAVIPSKFKVKVTNIWNGGND